MASTHVRLNRELHARLQAVSEFTRVPLTKLVDHIVADALPIYERQAQELRPVGVVPGFNDPRSATEIAKAAAHEARTAAAVIKHRAREAQEWDKSAKTKAAQEPKPRATECAHARIKVLSWGGHVCQDCQAIIS